MRLMWCEIQDDLISRLESTTFADFVTPKEVE
jgi:hypothetical protein